MLLKVCVLGISACNQNINRSCPETHYCVTNTGQTVSCKTVEIYLMQMTKLSRSSKWQDVK